MTASFFGCQSYTKEKQLDKFIADHVERIKPVEKQANLAWWAAATTGAPAEYEKLSSLKLVIRQLYSNPDEFTFLNELRETGQVANPTLARQLVRLHNAYLRNQIEADLLEAIVELETKVERNFSTFRGTIGSGKVTSNQIKQILKTETDSEERKQAWLASKQVAPIVASDIIRLVKLRNKAARKVGFNNFHTLSLAVTEQNVAEVDDIFNELHQLTNGPFAELKARLDEILAAKYGIDVTRLMPWHYHDPFFQETPLVYDLDLDAYYQDRDVKELAADFYAGMGLPVESILANSDLYDRQGKNPHAFCTDIDRAGDVRILCNLKNNEYWMETILHELGHAVYGKYHDPDVPYLLRRPVHSFTTEGIAMFFGRLSRDPVWIQQVLQLSDQQHSQIESVAHEYARLKQIIFARWAMVMYHFEKQLYANPDQDLNSLWWQMVEKYQLVKRPKDRNQPDWAAKIHIASSPCYYHNYVLGELFASQLHYYIAHNLLKLQSDQNVSYVNQRKAGDFLRQKVFETGALYHFNDMIARATGEPLTPKYFIAQFVE
jgi:peptidyl-dipeptidase A